MRREKQAVSGGDEGGAMGRKEEFASLFVQAETTFFVALEDKEGILLRLNLNKEMQVDHIQSEAEAALK